MDVLPGPVNSEKNAQYFETIKQLVRTGKLNEIKRKHINLILKLSCYRDISIDDEGVINPSPEYIREQMEGRNVLIRIGDSAIISEYNDVHLTVLNADTGLIELIQQIASEEGLYV